MLLNSVVDSALTIKNRVAKVLNALFYSILAYLYLLISP